MADSRQDNGFPVIQAQSSPAQSTADAADPLGKPLATFSTAQKVLTAYIGAVVIAVVGLLLLILAGAVARTLAGWMLGPGQGGDSPTPYQFLGGLLLVGALGLAVYAFLMAGRRFEVRRGGVRYIVGRRRQEMTWDAMEDIVVTKFETLDMNAMVKPVRVEWEIVLQSNDDTIILSKTLLNNVSNIHGLLSLLKMHSSITPRENGTGEEDFAAQAIRTERARAIAAAKRGAQPAKIDGGGGGGLDLPKAAAQKLASGVPASEVLMWLKQKGLPQEVAAKVLAKAIEG